MEHNLTDKQLSRLEDGREYRAMTMTVRSADEEGDMVVEGYATTFNQPYLLYDGRYYKLYEKIDPGAFNECDMTDVVMQYDHEGRVFARTKMEPFPFLRMLRGSKLPQTWEGRI